MKFYCDDCGLEIRGDEPLHRFPDECIEKLRARIAELESALAKRDEQIADWMNCLKDLARQHKENSNG